VNFMSYCPKCGNKVDETMTFCPNCGASLKTETTARPLVRPQTYRRNEKSEKHEKHQRNEKREKNEKGEFGFISWLVAGIIIIVIGVFAFAQAAGYITSPVENAIIIVTIGVAIILVAVWMAMRAHTRNPVPPS
jgi:uncharacterized membrane protein YvbJ